MPLDIDHIGPNPQTGEQELFYRPDPEKIAPLATADFARTGDFGSAAIRVSVRSTTHGASLREVMDFLGTTLAQAAGAAADEIAVIIAENARDLAPVGLGPTAGKLASSITVEKSLTRLNQYARDIVVPAPGAWVIGGFPPAGLRPWLLGGGLQERHLRSAVQFVESVGRQTADEQAMIDRIHEGIRTYTHNAGIASNKAKFKQAMAARKREQTALRVEERRQKAAAAARRQKAQAKVAHEYHLPSGLMSRVIPVYTAGGLIFRTATAENLAAGTFAYKPGHDFLAEAVEMSQPAIEEVLNGMFRQHTFAYGYDIQSSSIGPA